jgi:hypothetical protein
VDEASENPCEIRFFKTCHQKPPTCSNMKNSSKLQGFEVGWAFEAIDYNETSLTAYWELIIQNNVCHSSHYTPNIYPFI